MTAQTDPRESLWVRILLVLLAAGALVPIWVAPVPPLQDLPLKFAASLASKNV